MGLVIVCLLLAIVFWAIGLVLKISTKIIGGLTGIIGFVLIALLALLVLKITFTIVPVIIIVALGAFIYYKVKCKIDHDDDSVYDADATIVDENIDNDK